MARLGEESLFSHKIYPWDTWLDGQVWVLKKGEDFRCTIVAIRSALSAEAAIRGLRYRSTLLGRDEVAIQATGPKQAPGE